MIRKLLSRLFKVKNKDIINVIETNDIETFKIPEREPDENIVVLKTNDGNNSTRENVYYDKKEKKLIIDRWSLYGDHSFECSFPYEQSGFWDFKKDTNGELEKQSIFELYSNNNPYIAEIIKIQMQEIGINGQVYRDREAKISYIIKLDSEEDYAMFSLYFSEYINHGPASWGYGFNSYGGGGGGAGGTASMSISGGGGGVGACAAGQGSAISLPSNYSMGGNGYIVITCGAAGSGGSSP